MRSRFESATHASLCSCRVCTAASIVSCVEDGMLPVTAGNCGEPWRIVTDMIVNLHRFLSGLCWLIHQKDNEQYPTVILS